MCVCVYVYIYVHMHACMHAYVHVYTYINTHVVVQTVLRELQRLCIRQVVSSTYRHGNRADFYLGPCWVSRLGISGASKAPKAAAVAACTAQCPDQTARRSRWIRAAGPSTNKTGRLLHIFVAGCPFFGLVCGCSLLLRLVVLLLLASLLLLSLPLLWWLRLRLLLLRPPTTTMT